MAPEAGRRLHPLSPILGGVVGLLRTWPILILAVARSSWVLIGVLAVGLVMWRFVVWLRTTWSLDDDGLVIRSGLLWRTTQTVPPQRVQQVEVRQSLRHRATGLATVRVGLAGAGDTREVELDALSQADAEALRIVLERWRTDGAALDPAAPRSLPPPSVRLLAVETWQLVVAGLTSRSLWLAPLAAVAGLLQLLSDTRLDDDATDVVRDRLASASPVVVIVSVMILALVAAAVATVVRNHGLEVTWAGDDVAVRRGLAEQRSTTIPRRRVQSLELATNVVRARFGLGSLLVRTADLGGGGDAESTSVPIGSLDGLHRMVDLLLVPAVQPTELVRHPPAAVRREILRRFRRPLVLVVLVAVISADVRASAVALIAVLVWAVSTGWVAGRRLRSGWNPTAVVAEVGAVVRRRRVIPVNRVQSAAVTSDPFQRRLGLATVRLDVAGSSGGVVIRDLSFERATELLTLAVPVRWSAAVSPASNR